MAMLYFVRGWSFEQLAQRYGISGSRVRQLIRKWVERAVTLAYLQRIPPELPIAVDISPSRAVRLAKAPSIEPIKIPDRSFHAFFTV